MRKILFVEDRADLREVLSEMISKEGFQVIEAEDGYGGLAKLALGDVPDLIVTDVHMPILDGLSFLKALRMNPQFSKVPVLICSVDAVFSDLPIGLGDVRCTGKDPQTILMMIHETAWLDELPLIHR